MKISTSPRRGWLHGAILLLVFSLTLGIYMVHYAPPQVLAPRHAAVDRAVTTLPPGEIPAPETPADVPAQQAAASQSSEEPNAAGEQDEPHRDWIARVISETWTDAPDKLADRRRVRIVAADFKYPNIRLEESVTFDPVTGKESATLLRASVADHLMLGLRDGVAPEKAEAAIRDLGYTVRHVEPGSFILAEIPAFTSAEDQARAATELASLGEFIDHAEPDYLVFPCLMPNDPDYLGGKMWGLHNPGTSANSLADADIDGPEAWQIRRTAPGVVVAVTDTGINYDHEDLRDNMWTHPTDGSYGMNAYDNNSDPIDLGGHGTHCAGTIGARGDNETGLAGVAWEVELMALRFLGPNGGTTSDAIQVIHYARNNGAHIINASWGGRGYSQSLFNAIQSCSDAGIIVVAAAGNSSSNNDAVPTYPASFSLPNIVSVAATTPMDQLSAFSCFGRSSVHLAAPGSGIWSTYAGSETAYSYLNGTSMAAPYVTGALALAKAQFPTNDMGMLLDRLFGSVDAIPSLAGLTRTGGRLNLAGLLNSTLPPAPPHDQFEDAYRFVGDYGTWTGTNLGATREAGEDSFSLPGSGVKSLWLALHTPHAGLVTLDISGDPVLHTVVVFEGGQKDNLRIISQTGLQAGGPRRIQFDSQADKEYRILLDAPTGSSQRFAVRFNVSPANDFLAAATPVTGDRFTALGYNRGATRELFEITRPHAGVGQGRSVWWKWTAPANLNFTISTAESTFDTVLAVYTGNTPSSLVKVASNDDRTPLDWTSQVTFAATSGTTYYIAVDSFRADGMGDITLNGFRGGLLEIIRQPVSVEIELGRRAVFDVSVFSGGSVAYQWFAKGVAMPGQTSASLVIDPVRPQDLGGYHVSIRNSESILFSDPVTLSERQTIPRLGWKSGNLAVSSGIPVKFSAIFTGSDPMTYSWTKNGAPVPGEENSSLAFPSAATTDSGSYRLTATNPVGTAHADFTFTVAESPWDRWEWRHPGVFNSAITDIKVYEGEAFAISCNVLLRSSDGENWSKSLFPNGFFAQSIAKKGSSFLALGINPNNAMTVAISTDGAATWTLSTATGFSGIYQPELYLLTSFGSVYLANSPNGNDVLQSTNGIDWNTITANRLDGSSVIMRGNGRFASDGTSLILASTSTNSANRMRYFRSMDGVSWTERETHNVGTSGTSQPQAAHYGLGKFHLVDTNSIYTSEDGLSWTIHPATNSGITKNSHFCASPDLNFVFTESTSSFRWFTDPAIRSTRTLQPTNSHRFSAAASFGDSVLYGTDKGMVAAIRDPDEVHCPLQSIPSMTSIEFADGIFIAGTNNLTSGDGITWKPAPKLDNSGATITGRAFGKTWGNMYLKTAAYVGHNSFDLRLNDRVDIGLDPNINFIGQLPNGNALAVTIDPYGTAGAKLLARAAGASTWTQATLPSGVDSATKFTSIGNRWLSGFGSHSAAFLYMSSTGQSWTTTNIKGSNPHLVSLPDKSWLIYQSEMPPYYPTMAASSTNINSAASWASLTTTGIPSNNSGRFAKRVVGHEGRLVLLGADENIYFSENGALWLRGFTPGKVVDIAAGNGQLIALMKNGGIIQAGNAHPGGSAPMVSIVSPQTTSTHLVGSRITIEGTVSDPEDGVASYECYFDSELVSSGSGNAFQFEATMGDPNGHTITVWATDSHGLRQMDSVRLRVVDPTPENLLVSDEGKSHVPHTFSTTFDGVFYTAGQRVVYRSLDGVRWERVTIPGFVNPIFGMASGNGALVIQFTNGAIITTRDGVNWTHFQPNLSDYWVREPIRFSSGAFIAAYQTKGSTSGSIMTSTDGLRWTVGLTTDLGYLTWSANSDDGTILGAAGYLSGVRRTTDDGFNWFPIAPLASASWTNSHGIFAGGKFVVAITDTVSQIFTSEDGIDWDAQPLPAGITNLPALGHVGGRYFLGRSSDFSYVSTDGISWQPMSHAVHRYKITYSRGLFVAHSTVSGLLMSRDAIQWTPVPGLPSSVSKVLANESIYLVIDSIGGVWSSRDGVEWSLGLPGKTTTATISGTGMSIAQLGGGAIVTAGGGLLVTSQDDGRTWSHTSVNGQPPLTTRTFHKVVAGQSELLVLEGTNSGATVLMRSVDGVFFATVPGLPAKTWRDIAWNGSEWMLLASDGTLFRSTSGGISWTQIPTSGMARGSSVVWFNNRWVIIGAVQDSWMSPYLSYTLEAGDVLQSHNILGIAYSTYTARALVSHGKLLVWSRGDPPCISENGTTWSNSNLYMGGVNYDFDVYHTPNGFQAFGGTSFTNSPPRIWESGPDGLAWQSIPAPFTTVTYAENLGNRLFLFSSGSISELHTTELALTLPVLEPVTRGVGDRITAAVTIHNFGSTLPSDATWRVTAWLSRNRFFGDGKNVPIGTFDFTAAMPAPGASGIYNVDFTLPNDIVAGNNHLILSLSSLSGIVETNTANNTVISAAPAIHIPEWEFSVATNGNGEVHRDFAATRYPHKAQVSLAAAAGKGAMFVGWEGDALSPNNQITILMDGNKSLLANFSDRTTLQIFTRGAGDVVGLAELGSYPVGSTAAISAEPLVGWEFSHWSGAADTTEPVASVEMDTSKSLTAHFVQPMETWSGLHFTPEQRADPEISGDGKDPDGDRVPNWLEYLHGSDPDDKGSTGISPTTLAGDSLRCVYTRNLGAENGSSVTCEGSRGLDQWDAPDLQERVLSTVDGIETVEARLPVSGGDKGFIRFRYVAPAAGE